MKRVARKKPARRQTSTALVRRPARRPAKAVVDVLPPAEATVGSYTVAADGALQLGALGLVEVKLTEKEEQILSEPVDAALVEWKPRTKGGPPEIPYLPHHVYTHWFTRAFGRMGWSLVPIGKPIKDEHNVVLVPYVLHIHTKPVAFAWGEQEYFPENKQQTYGDVVESTVASALRRCAKHLGVGLEMWDRRFLRRLKSAPLAGETRPPQSPAPPRPTPGPHASELPAGHHQWQDEPITQAQRQRLVMIAKHAGRADTEVRMWLQVRYGMGSSKEIRRRDYDEVCRAIEAPGPLPMPREPGEEG